jgi:DNA-binding NarL/FixJ family response regulator
MLDLWVMSDSASRRDSLAKCVDSNPEIRVVGIASGFPFLRTLIEETSADLALIDLQSDALSASDSEWLQELIELTPIVLLTHDSDPSILNRIRRAGPGGLLRADAPCDRIVQAIKAVAAGLTVFDSLAEPQSSEEESPREELTPRETEVLRLLADGLGNKDIAVKLGISEHTIKFHIRSILGKLGAATRTEAVTRGLRSGLIEM